MRSPAISKTAPNGDVDRRLRATQPSMPSPAKTTPSRIIDGSARSTGRKWIMAMTTKSRMSRAIVMRLAMSGAAIPRGRLLAVAARSIDFRAGHPDADSTDYPRGRASAQQDEADGTIALWLYLSCRLILVRRDPLPRLPTLPCACVLIAAAATPPRA